MTTRSLAHSLLRENFYLFSRRAFAHLERNTRLGRPRYLEAMCYALQSAHQRDRGRLVITVPPRHLKSITSAVALPAWAIGRDPSLKVLVATYGDELARQHSEHFASIIRSPWYRALFPSVEIASSNRHELHTTQGGGRRAVTLGGATTGFGADLIIVDDLMKAQEASSDNRREAIRRYFAEALASRFNQPERGSLISIQQRLHEDDLPASLLASGRFEHLNLPAIAETVQEFPLYRGRVWRRANSELLEPERISRDRLEELREDLGSVAFSAQYQQDPVPPDGAVIRLDRLHVEEEVPSGEQFQYVVQSWDTAASLGPGSDYSVCTTWGYYNRAWYLADLYRKRVEFDGLESEILRQKEVWEPDKILIEDSSNGRAILQRFKSTKRADDFVRVTPKEPKLDRLVTQLDFLHSDRVRFCSTDAWWQDLRRELAGFPHGRHDDQVDSISQFCKWIRGRFGRRLLDRDPQTGQGGQLKDEFGRYRPFDGVL